MRAGTQLTKQRFFLVGKRIIETARTKEVFGRTNREDLHDTEIASTIDAVLDELVTDPVATKVVMHREALELGQLGAVDFDCRKPNALAVGFRVKAVARQLNDFGFRATEQQMLRHIRSHQSMNGRRVTWKRLADFYDRLGFNGFKIIGFRCISQFGLLFRSVGNVVV